MWYAVAAYLLWGAVAAYFPLLQPAGPVEIISHRIVWTAVLMAAILVATKSFSELRKADRSTWIQVVLAAFFIAGNWLTYVIAVNSGHVAEAALGYFMNPLVNVVLGMVFLGERLRFLQKISVCIAAIAVAILTFATGEPPIIALLLAGSFGCYGLVKKRIQLSAGAGLAAETFALVPIAGGYLIYLETQAQSTFVTHGPVHTVLLIATGLVTAIPLLLFNKAARLIPLSTIGMLQYISPTMQMLWAVLVMQEHLPAVRWLGFCIIWISVAIFLGDLWLHRKAGRARVKTAQV